jgi:hypothetical protein
MRPLTIVALLFSINSKSKDSGQKWAKVHKTLIFYPIGSSFDT